MARTAWGNVYYGETFAGVLSELPGGRVQFQYDKDYLSAEAMPVSFTLPLAETPHISEFGLHPFFDNLVAEGWLQEAQCKAIGVDKSNRLALLLAFGADCAGAVSVIDPERVAVRMEPDLPEVMAALTSRASISGVQPKLFAVKEDGKFNVTKPGQLSSHIAKLPSPTHNHLLELEWLTTKATKALLPTEEVVELELAELPGIAEQALMIKRFDRDGQERLHFEEFNTLVGNMSDAKYSGSYEEMGKYIQDSPACLSVEAERLFRRVLGCLLLGNTDAHLKNFAMMHRDGRLSLSPAYDLVASSWYKQYNSIALSVGGASNLRLSDLAPKHVVSLAAGFALSEEVVALAVEGLNRRREAVTKAVEGDLFAPAPLKSEFLELMEKRWNGTFGSVGTLLSKRHAREEKLKGFRKRD
jgi:serine/threonine-protein kinase HipA